LSALTELRAIADAAIDLCVDRLGRPLDLSTAYTLGAHGGTAGGESGEGEDGEGDALHDG
jgi:hypothetical protein